MLRNIIGDGILICLLLLFSWWLMVKSFGYDTGTSQFRIARHEVGDFGLHISLIRSFAWGNNSPAQSPFFSGEPLAYHYGVDWLTGHLVRSGIRIDYALNGVSALALTLLLYVLYRLGGLLTVVLFLLPSNLSFIDIFKQAPKDSSFFSYFWRFPDYIHKGPFDGSIITIYSTLAPYLNQRHLIAGMAIGVCVIWLVTHRARKKQSFAILGLILGLATRVHLLVAIATGIVVAIVLLGKRSKALLFFLGAAFLTASPHLMQIISMRSETSQLWNPGYLATRPLSLVSWIYFWIANLGVLVVFIPLAFRHADSTGKRVLLGAGVLFLVADIFQVSYRMEHNHSLINYMVVLTLPFVSRLLESWWRRDKFVVLCALIFITASGAFNLMVVKNDYQLMVDDAPKNRLMEWIRKKTPPDSIFITLPALYDPITLAGRKNYLGSEYYVSVMGYDYWGRRRQINTWLTNFSQAYIQEMKKNNIDYLVIPKEKQDFPYAIDEKKAEVLLRSVYQDDSINVYEL